MVKGDYNMKNKLFSILMSTMVMLTVLPMPAYAGNQKVNSVSVNLNEEKSDPGVIYPVEVTANSSYYEISSVDVSKDYGDWKPGRKVTYTITIDAKDGYSFSKKDTRLYASNGTLTSNNSVKSGSIEMKVNYIPKVTLQNPENIYFEDEYEAVWDEVEYASAYEVKIYKDGSYHKTEKITKNKIDLSNYATDYEDITFDVRAVAKDSDESKYLRDSEWVNCDETISSGDNTTYGSFIGNYDNYRFQNADGSYATGWQQINGSWYYFNAYATDKPNAAIQSSWAFINDRWYFFNEYCMMQTGWHMIDGNWYYLDSSGAMLTGWFCAGPSGPWYYLDTNTGAMWHNTTTPDGYYVNSNGAWYN